MLSVSKILTGNVGFVSICLSMDTNLLRVLGDVGFTDKEARIYTALTELGEGTVAQIAKKAELKRPIVYVVIGGLMARGYVSELPNKQINTYQATDASVILRRIQLNVKNFLQFIPVFRTLRNRGGAKPKISYLENKEGILNIYEEMNHEPEPFFITSYARLEECFPGVVKSWVENYKNGYYKKLRGYHIIPNDPRETENAKVFKTIDQQVRTLPDLRGSLMDFTIYGNKLAISCLTEKPFMVVIESIDVVNSLRPIFKIVWERAKEI